MANTHAFMLSCRAKADEIAEIEEQIINFHQKWRWDLIDHVEVEMHVKDALFSLATARNELIKMWKEASE